MALKSKPLGAVHKDLPVHEVGGEELVRVNLQVPASVRKAWKTAALREDVTVTDLIVRAMTEQLAKLK
jgi:hypothetical protein